MAISTNNILMVLTNPVPGREDEYNDWYTNVHLAEVLEFPGFVSARRFKLGKEQLDLEGWGLSSHGYLAMYEVEGDADAAIAKIKTALASGQLAVTESLDPNVFTAAFAAITETVTEPAAVSS